MSNIERRYAYLDEGVFPEEGEYGVTYLTLYSSNAGNTYDGWVYDPDNKVRESLTERTYGYRNPDYPQYCWDDEVVVDLSNAQSRQESSEYTQGRITSFNTNVSDRPIILQDIDITGLTEEERENRATTVLFSAIPLVQDAYIQAQVEVQCKCNLSPDNTSGEMRIEAFYILNDESDRTMRPNPVHTFTVTSANERHTLPWLYWNPALRHEDHNYIGVKLICTGGTAEIGISDNPDYGDAMITLASAGLTGDKIDGGKPVYLEIFGKEEVVGGYELDINDYTVLCTYDTGEIYEVTRMCDFSPAMGTKIVDALTTLTATYQGLRASMTIRLGMVESIELSGLEDIYESYTFKLTDFVVLAYLDNGDIMDVTGECTYSPEMGTTVTQSTVLTATYQPYWMVGASFTDSINLTAHGEPIASASPNNGLVYRLFTDHHITITGNSHLVIDENTEEWEQVRIPDAIKNMMYSDAEYSIEWAAEGCISGVSLGSMKTSFLKGFDDVVIKPRYIKRQGSSGYNPITISFADNSTIKSDDLMFLNNIDYNVRGWDSERVLVNNNSFINTFSGCESLTHLDFLSKLELHSAESNNPNFMSAFDGCSDLTDISGISHLDMSYTSRTDRMFQGCESLTSIESIFGWKLYNVWNASRMFYGSGLESLYGCEYWELGKDFKHNNPESICPNVNECFANTKINSLEDIGEWFSSRSVITRAVGTFRGNLELTDLSGSEDWDMNNIESIDSLLANCSNLVDITQTSNWRLANGCSAIGVFAYDDNIEHISIVNNWLLDCAQTYNMLKTNDADFVHAVGSGILKPSDDLEAIFGPLTNGKIKVYTDGNGGSTATGMFANRDSWRWIKDGGTIIGMQFIYPECVPLWYMTMISEDVGYPIVN